MRMPNCQSQRPREIHGHSAPGSVDLFSPETKTCKLQIVPLIIIRLSLPALRPCLHMPPFPSGSLHSNTSPHRCRAKNQNCAH
jgi:hypothetical protein